MRWNPDLKLWSIGILAMLAGCATVADDPRPVPDDQSRPRGQAEPLGTSSGSLRDRLEKASGLDPAEESASLRVVGKECAQVRREGALGGARLIPAGAPRRV